MPAKIQTVVGVHVDRTGGTAMIGDVEIARNGTTRLRLHPSPKETQWQTGSNSVLPELEAFARTAAELGGQNIKMMGVSGPGPFRSLRRSHKANDTFGLIDEERAHRPLNGQNLYKVFKDAVSSSNHASEADVIVHTDAMACAIGESVSRGLEPNKLLAFFIVGDGIGLGLVRGASPIRTALHPEVGLISVQLHPKEGKSAGARIIRKGVTYSVAEMASDLATKGRCGNIHVDLVTAFQALSFDVQKEILDRRAYYLAQMCLACTAMLPPHQIVLGQDVRLEPGETLAKRVYSSFDELINLRKKNKQPVFQYPEMLEPGFISDQKDPPGLTAKSKIGLAGAMGMAYAAAAAQVENNEIVVDMA